MAVQVIELIYSDVATVGVKADSGVPVYSTAFQLWTKDGRLVAQAIGGIPENRWFRPHQLEGCK
jgi:hypothetical protein